MDRSVVTLPAGCDVIDVAAALHGGARGFMREDAAADALFVSVATALTVGAGPQCAAAARVSAPITPPLTEREYQVLVGMAAGKSKAEIGQDLFISEDTIKTHARHLFHKLGVADRAEAVAAGFRRGLLR